MAPVLKNLTAKWSQKPGSKNRRTWEVIRTSLEITNDMESNRGLWIRISTATTKKVNITNDLESNRGLRIRIATINKADGTQDMISSRVEWTPMWILEIAIQTGKTAIKTSKKKIWSSHLTRSKGLSMISRKGSGPIPRGTGRSSWTSLQLLRQFSSLFSDIYLIYKILES